MVWKSIISLVIAIGPVGCAAKEKKSDMDGWAKCQPIMNAIQEISKAGQYNVSAVEKIFKINSQHPKCDDGIYGEGMTDIVAKSLASDFSNIALSSHRNKDLSHFLMKHIDSTADWSDLDKSAANAKTSCPKNTRDFCNRVIDLSEKASADAKAWKKQ